jgi:hypothetical protein
MVQYNTTAPSGSLLSEHYGSPRCRRRPRRAPARESTIEIIDRLLLRPRSISLNGGQLSFQLLMS